MTSSPPASGPAPSRRCLRCGEPLVEAGPSCPACGGSQRLEPAEERGRVVYLLRAFEQAAREGLLSAAQAQRLAWRFGQPFGLAPAAPAGPAAPVRPARPPRPPVNPTVVWANGLLYLGAFFVVMTALLFLLALGGLGRTLLSTGVAVAFLGAGALCRRIEMVRSAGSVFVGTGALLVPLIFVSLATYLTGAGPLAPRLIWLSASLACLLLYALLTFLGLGRFYAVLTLIAVSNGFLALHAAAQWDERFYPTLFAAQALCLWALHSAGGQLVRRYFGPLVLVWGLLWTLPALMGWALVSVFSSDDAPLSVLALLIVLGWLTHWRQPNPVSPALAGTLQLAFVGQLLRWADAPTWSLGLAFTLMAAAYVGLGHAWRASLAGRELFLLGVAAALGGSLPVLFEGARLAGCATGFLGAAVLAAAALLAGVPALLVPAGWPLAVGWYYLVALLSRAAGSPAELAVAYLPLVTLLAVAALVVPDSGGAWRWPLGLLCAVFSFGTVALALERSGPLSAALALATLAGAALAARWRAPWLALAPSGTAAMLVLSLLAWLDAPREGFGPSVLGLGLALWSAGLLARGRAASRPLRVAGGLVSALAFVVGWGSQVAHAGSGVNWSAHLDALTLLALALWIAWEGLEQRPLLYPASLVLVTALLWEAQALGLRNLQGYALPLGAWCVAVGLVAARDSRLGRGAETVAALAWTLAGVAFCLPTLLQTFGDHTVRYAVLLLAESFVLIVLGLLVKRRGLQAGATTFAILAGLRMVFQNPDLILPAFAAASCTFFSVGLGVLVWQGLKRRRAVQAGPPPDSPA